MKAKHIFSIVIFFSIFAVLFTLTTYLLRPEDDGAKEAVAGFYAEKKNTLDTVFFGGSACYRFVSSPLLFKNYGITSYVFGTAAQPFDTTPALITESEKSQNPSLYVVEIRNLISDDMNIKNKDVNPITVTHYMRLVTDNLLFSYNRFKLITDVVTDTDKTSWYFDIIKNHTNWKTLTRESLNLMLYNKESPVKGARTVPVLQPLEEWDPTSYTGEKTALQKKSENILRNVLDFCKKQKLNVLFVSTPYLENQLSISEENYVADIIKKYGYKYLNCNYYYKDMGIDFSTDFYNDRHVNTLGAVKVTNFLSKYITENFTISSKHTSSTTAEWNKAYETWSALAKYQETALTAAINRSKS